MFRQIANNIALRSAVILVISFFDLQAESAPFNQEYVERRAAEEAKYHRELLSFINQFEIWWVKPKDAKWRKCTFKKLSKEQADKITKLVKSSKLSKTAGDFHLIDKPLDWKGVEGYLLFVDSKTKKVRFSYKLDYRMIEKKDLKRVECREVNFIDMIKIDNPGDFYGIVLDEDVRDVLTRNTQP